MTTKKISLKISAMEIWIMSMFEPDMEKWCVSKLQDKRESEPGGHQASPLENRDILSTRQQDRNIVIDGLKYEASFSWAQHRHRREKSRKLIWGVKTDIRQVMKADPKWSQMKLLSSWEVTTGYAHGDSTLRNRCFISNTLLQKLRSGCAFSSVSYQ